MGHSPWWKNIPQTAEQVCKGLVLAFRQIAVFPWWDTLNAKNSSRPAA
jgi:hypothetical protein